ncbi:MAG: biopolymer transporter ExbD [Bacteroidota bacterium]|nr:biopolymer transporter ExbD [Bacteroidota bacterium]
MADIESSGGGGGKHKGKKRGKKLSTRIDMTPMVDLAFLLVTFFMLATTMAKPSALEVTMPTDEKPKEDITIPESKSMTLILGKDDQIFWYMGMLTKDPVISKTTYGPANIRKVLKAKQIEVRNIFVQKAKSQEIVVLIKPMKDSKYRNLVDILDEFEICGIKQFAVVDFQPDDQKNLKKKGLVE